MFSGLETMFLTMFSALMQLLVAFAIILHIHNLFSRIH